MSDVINKLRVALSYSPSNPRYYKFAKYYRILLDRALYEKKVDMKEAKEMYDELNSRDIQHELDITGEDLKKMCSLLIYNYENDVLNSLGWVKLGKLKKLCEKYRDNLYPLRNDSMFKDVGSSDLTYFIKLRTEAIKELINENDDSFYGEMKRMDTLIRGCVRGNKILSNESKECLKEYVDLCKLVYRRDREVYRELSKVPNLTKIDEISETVAYHKIKAFEQIVIQGKDALEVYRETSDYLVEGYKHGLFTGEQADYLLTIYGSYIPTNTKEGYKFESLLSYEIFLDSQDVIYLLRQTRTGIEDSYVLVKAVLEFLEPANLYKEIEKRALFNYDLGIITYSRDKSDHLAEHPEDGLEFVEHCIDSMYDNGLLNESEWSSFFRRIREVLATNDIRHR